MPDKKRFSILPPIILAFLVITLATEATGITHFYKSVIYVYRLASQAYATHSTFVFRFPDTPASLVLWPKTQTTPTAAVDNNPPMPTTLDPHIWGQVKSGGITCFYNAKTLEKICPK